MDAKAFYGLQSDARGLASGEEWAASQYRDFAARVLALCRDYEHLAVRAAMEQMTMDDIGAFADRIASSADSDGDAR